MYSHTNSKTQHYFIIKYNMRSKCIEHLNNNILKLEYDKHITSNHYY